MIILGDRMNKVWFITGAGSGIGAATARAARKAGHRVVATGRNMEKLREALADVAGDDLLLERLDVTSEAEAKRAVDDAVARIGRIDVLVNNAGYSLLGNFEEFTTEQIERQFAPNFSISPPSPAWSANAPWRPTARASSPSRDSRSPSRRRSSRSASRSR